MIRSSFGSYSGSQRMGQQQIDSKNRGPGKPSLPPSKGSTGQPAQPRAAHPFRSAPPPLGAPGPARRKTQRNDSAARGRPETGKALLTSSKAASYSGNQRLVRGQTSSPSASAKVSIPKKRNGENDCVVVAVANGTGAAYTEVRAAALEHGYTPGGAWNYQRALSAMSDLGLYGSYHGFQPSTWSQFPSKAVIGVHGVDGPHAVALDGDYIIDGTDADPVHRNNYTLLYGSSYIRL